VQLDTAALELGVSQAKAAQKRAVAQVAVLGGNLTTVKDNQSKLATARNQLATAAAGLAKGAAALKKAESQFAAKKADALKKRAQLVQLRAILSAQLAALEHSPSPDPATIARLKGQIAGIDKAIAGIDKGLSAAAAGFAKGNAQIATGSAKLSTARVQLATGASALSKAKRQLDNARNVSRLSLAAQDAGVTLAEVRLSQATILAPVAGTVTEARTAGTVAMVGAPLVRIRADGPTKISTYLTGEQLSVVPVGTPAEVDYDSNTGAALAGKVTRVGLQSQFPPTSFPTNIVHMTQAVRVEVTLDGSGWAPPGTPVDLVLRTTAGR
jgi:multidrug resistance efflux pump